MALVPATAVIPNTTFLIALNLTFFTSIVSVAILVYSAVPKKKRVKKIENPMSLRQLNINVMITSIGSIIGTLLVFFDRVFIRGLDYSAGLRAARYQWLDSSGGSLPSVIGNLLVPLGYISIFFIVIHGKSLTKGKIVLLFSSAFISVLGHAALNGGRSNVLLAAIFTLLTLAIKSDYRKEPWKFKFKWWYLIVILIPGYYVISIVFSSAEMGGVSMPMLTYLGIDALFGKISAGFWSLENISEHLYLLIYLLVYLFHGQWTTQVAYSLPFREGNYTFFAYGSLLRQLGILKQPLEPGYFASSGAFISLPGAFYYDFGFVGMVFCSIFVGGLFGLALGLIDSAYTISGYKLAFIYYIFFIIVMSPVLPAYGMVYLNFLIISFVFLDFFNKRYFRYKVNWLDEVK